MNRPLVFKIPKHKLNHYRRAFSLTPKVLLPINVKVNKLGVTHYYVVVHSVKGIYEVTIQSEAPNEDTHDYLPDGFSDINMLKSHFIMLGTYL